MPRPRAKEEDHVRTDPEVRRHRQALALELRAELLQRYGDARHISYREIDRLVAAHHGDVREPEDDILRLKLAVLGEILARRRTA